MGLPVTSYPVFAHRERDTFSHDALWESPCPRESPAQTTDRLVLHGLRCGKRDLTALAYHAGFVGARHRGSVVEALKRLQRAGKVRAVNNTWEPL